MSKVYFVLYITKHNLTLLVVSSLGGVSVDKIDEDSTSHGNRIRSFPHERGNWASYVHIPINFS